MNPGYWQGQTVSYSLFAVREYILLYGDILCTLEHFYLIWCARKTFCSLAVVYEWQMVKVSVPVKPRLHIGHFYSHWQHKKTFLSDVAGIVKPECFTCIRVTFCNEIAGTMLQNIHQIELFAICCRYWGHLEWTLATSVSQNSFEGVKLPVRVENCRCSHSFKADDYFTRNDPNDLNQSFRI